MPIITAITMKECTCLLNRKEVVAGAARREMMRIAPTISNAVTTQMETSVIRI